MKRVFVFEYLTGGGTIAGDTHGLAAAELMSQGRSMRDALVNDLRAAPGCEISVACCERAPLAEAASGPSAEVNPVRMRKMITAQARRGESVFDFVARQAAEHDACWIVAPETDGLLARFHDLVGPERWLGCERETIALTTRKTATLRRLAAHGVATPLDFIGPGSSARAGHTGLGADPPLRWVVKPEDGAGGVETRVHASLAAAQQDAKARGGVASAVEPWVDGEPLSLSLLCGGGRAELLSVNRQRIVVDRAGHLSYQGVEVNAVPLSSDRAATLHALALQLARHALPGLRGFVGVDLVWHADRGPVVIEVNPRVTCAYVGLSAALGRNLAAELLARHTVEHAHAIA